MSIFGNSLYADLWNDFVECVKERKEYIVCLKLEIDECEEKGKKEEGRVP
jgi:hypothetical protein